MKNSWNLKISDQKKIFFCPNQIEKFDAHVQHGDVGAQWSAKAETQEIARRTTRFEQLQTLKNKLLN